MQNLWSGVVLYILGTIARMRITWRCVVEASLTVQYRGLAQTRPTCLRRCGLSSAGHPAIIRRDLAVLQISAPQPGFDLHPVITIFDWSREAIKLVIHTNSKWKPGVLFHRHFFSQLA